MKALKTIELGPKTIEYKGLQQLANVVAYVYLDESCELDWDFEPGEKEKLERKLERGDITPCGIEVRATLDGISGADSCWGFLIESTEDIMEAIRDHDMVDNACAQLVLEIGSAVTAAKSLVERFG